MKADAKPLALAVDIGIVQIYVALGVGGGEVKLVAECKASSDAKTIAVTMINFSTGPIQAHIGIGKIAVGVGTRIGHCGHRKNIKV